MVPERKCARWTCRPPGVAASRHQRAANRGVRSVGGTRSQHLGPMHAISLAFSLKRRWRSWVFSLREASLAITGVNTRPAAEKRGSRDTNHHHPMRVSPESEGLLPLSTLAASIGTWLDGIEPHAGLNQRLATEARRLHLSSVCKRLQQQARWGAAPHPHDHSDECDFVDIRSRPRSPGPVSGDALAHSLSLLGHSPALEPFHPSLGPGRTQWRQANGSRKGHDENPAGVKS